MNKFQQDVYDRYMEKCASLPLFGAFIQKDAAFSISPEMQSKLMASGKGALQGGVRGAVAGGMSRGFGRGVMNTFKWLGNKFFGNGDMTFKDVMRNTGREAVTGAKRGGIAGAIHGGLKGYAGNEGSLAEILREAERRQGLDPALIAANL